MSQEPKKRHSRARQGKRRASISLKQPNPAHRMTKFNAMLEKEQAEKQVKKVAKTTAETEEE